jgi:FkbM family methyltransferase
MLYSFAHRLVQIGKHLTLQMEYLPRLRPFVYALRSRYYKLGFVDKDILSDVILQADDIAIDCGANIGNITARLAAKGATIYAFEPNPFAFNVLKKRFTGSKNVHCINKGVLDRDGMVQLYLHENSPIDPVKWSTGSSLLKSKSNVDDRNFITVEVVDLCCFIQSLHRRIKMIKMDVEGVEFAILNRMIDTGVIHSVDRLIVETHDRLPELRREDEKLRHRIAREGLDNISLDWV